MFQTTDQGSNSEKITSSCSNIGEDVPQLTKLDNDKAGSMPAKDTGKKEIVIITVRKCLATHLRYLGCRRSN